MGIDTTRRLFVAAIAGGGVVGGALSPVRGYLDRFAPFSGSAWDSATDDANRRIESPTARRPSGTTTTGRPRFDRVPAHRY